MNLLIVGTVLLFATGAIGAAAYNSFQADRGASIDVVNDANGILTFTPGSSGFVYEQSNGEMTIDTTAGGANGVNVNSTLKIGNTSDATNDPGFTVTNNDNNAHDVTFSYSAVSDSTEPSSDNVIFHVYDNGGTEVGTFSEGSQYTISSMSAGASYYVVIEVDTMNLDASADDLSGTMTVTAK